MQYINEPIYYPEGTFKVSKNPVTGTQCRTGQLNHLFVEQKEVGGVWITIAGYTDIAGAGCRFREGVRGGDYVVDVELEVAGFLLAENVGWENIGGASGGYSVPLPQFAIPNTGLQLMVGQSVTIYGDSLISIPVSNHLTVTYTCNIGSQSGNDYTINPVTGDIGNHDLTMVFKNGAFTILTKTISFAVNAKVISAGIRVLRIGDSTMAGDGIGGMINTILPGVSIEWLGTQGTTAKSEGRAGWAFVDFITGTRPSPFWKAGVLDIASYFTDNAIAIPDIVYIRLGMNDVFNSNYVLNTVLGYSQTLVDAFLAYNSKLRIVIALPTTCVNDSATWLADYPAGGQDAYIEKIHGFQVGLVNKYAGGVYNARVDCSYEAINISRTVVTGYANGVHPSNGGYQQLADGLSCYINKEITNLFGAELIDQAAWCAAGGAYWDDVFAACWSGDGIKLICNGNGYASKVGPWTGGKTYRIVDTMTNYVVGYMRAFYDKSTYQETQYADATTIWNYTMTGSGLKYLTSLSAGGGQFNITKLSIREVL
jgi:lysophospholipase L1-like esterase